MDANTIAFTFTKPPDKIMYALLSLNYSYNNISISVVKFFQIKEVFPSHKAAIAEQ